MRNRGNLFWRLTALLLLVTALVTLSTRLRADTQTTGICGGAAITIPFTDVPSSNIFFCSIASAYFSGLTNGTSPTTYTPSQPVPREQMAAFVTRTLDQSLRRGSRRAALKQWWTPTEARDSQRTLVGDIPHLVECDGADLWVANNQSDSVSRVRASDGRLLETWTGATDAFGVLVAEGRVYITGQTSPGQLYLIDPRNAVGGVSLLTNNLGSLPASIAYDSARIWTANIGSVSIVTHTTLNASQPEGSDPVTVTTVSAGFVNPFGMLYDGANIWVTDRGDDRLKKLNADASIATFVAVGDASGFPVFDGTNI